MERPITADEYYQKMIEIEEKKLEEMKRHNVVKEQTLIAKRLYYEHKLTQISYSVVQSHISHAPRPEPCYEPQMLNSSYPLVSKTAYEPQVQNSFLEM